MNWFNQIFVSGRMALCRVSCKFLISLSNSLISSLIPNTCFSWLAWISGIILKYSSQALSEACLWVGFEMPPFWSVDSWFFLWWFRSQLTTLGSFVSIWINRSFFSAVRASAEKLLATWITPSSLTLPLILTWSPSSVYTVSSSCELVFDLLWLQWSRDVLLSLPVLSLRSLRSLSLERL